MSAPNPSSGSFLESKETRLVEAVREYQAALDRGETPSREQFLSRYGELAGELVDCLDNLDFLRSVGPNLIDATITSGGQESAATDTPPISQLGDFQIIREVGRGGMGVVYEAKQKSMSRRVALKVLPFASVLDPKTLQRFRSEAQIAGQLVHQNIVPVYSVGCERNVHYYAMQFIDGQTLADLIADLRTDAARQVGSNDEASGSTGGKSHLDASTSPMAALSTARSNASTTYVRAAARLFIQVVRALEYAHGQGVIHRDIKPSNLMVDREGNVWVTDFGLAHVETGPSVTVTGDFLGTLRYMSPEQALAQRVVIDHRTDVYSLGVTFYELLTLQPAFPGDNRQELLRQISFEEPTRPRRVNQSIPADLETILLRAIEKNPSDRYETAKEFADDLERFIADLPIQARRPTAIQRTQKWCRRHSSLVATVVVSLFTVMAFVAFGSALLAVQLNKAAENERQMRTETLAANQELATTLDENAALLSRSYINKAQLLCEKGEIASGILWLARALEVAPENASDLQRVVRNAISAWHRQLPSLRLLVKQRESVQSVALSLDGRRLFTGSDKGTVQAFDAISGHSLARSSEHGGAIKSIAVAPSRELVATASEDGTSRLWAADTLTPIGEPLDFFENDGVMWQVHDVLFGPDGDTVISGGRDARTGRRHQGKVVVWDRRTGNIQKSIRITGGVERLRHTPKGLLAALRIDGSTFQLWNVDTNQAVGPKVQRRDTIVLAISPDGTRLAGSGYGSNFTIWNAATGEQLNNFNSSGLIYSLDFNKDGTRLLSAGLDQAVRLWDIATGRSIAMPLRHQAPVQVASFAMNETRILTGTGGDLAEEGTARIWDVAARAPESSRVEHDDGVRLLSFTGQGLRMITRQRGGRNQLRDGDALVPIGEPIIDAYIGVMEFTDDGSIVAVSGDRDLHIRNANTGEQIAMVKKERGNFAMDFSSDGRYLLTGGLSGQISMWDASSLHRIGEPIVLPKRVTCVAFSHDAQQFVTGSYDGTIRVWDANSRTQIGDSIQFISEVNSLALSPDSTRVFVGCADGSASLWNLQTRMQIGPSIQHEQIVCDAKFSPDASQIVSCSTDGSTYFWDAATLEPVGPPITRTGKWSTVSFSTDGRRFASDWGEVWDISRPKILGNVEDVGVWAKIVTGWSMNKAGQMRKLDSEEWTDLRTAVIDKNLRNPGLPTHLELSGDDVFHEASARFLAAEAAAKQDWRSAITFCNQVIDGAQANWADVLLRARALLATNRWQDAERDFDTAVSWASDDSSSPRLERGMFHLSTGRRQKAAADFAHIIGRRGENGNRWLMSDWWISGPFPGGLDSPDPFSDVQEAITRLESTGDTNDHHELDWRRATKPAYGGNESRFLHILRPGGEEVSMYVLRHIYSEEEQEVTMLLGYNKARVWMNGEEILSSDFTMGPLPPDQDFVLSTLRQGWNTVLVKLATDWPSIDLYFRISARREDRTFALATAAFQAGEWARAAEHLVEGCRLCDDQYRRARRLVTVAARLKKQKATKRVTPFYWEFGDRFVSSALKTLEQDSDPQDPVGDLFLSLIHQQLENREAASRCYRRAVESEESIAGDEADELERLRAFVAARIMP